MSKVIVFDNADASGGISIVIPAEKARQRVLVTPAVIQDIMADAEIENPETGETERIKHKVGERVVSEVVYRPETDDEFLPRVAAKSVPDGTEWRVMDKGAAYALRQALNQGSYSS